MPAILLKVALLHGCFSRFLNCTNVTKLRKTQKFYLFVFQRLNSSTVKVTGESFIPLLKKIDEALANIEAHVGSNFDIKISADFLLFQKRTVFTNRISFLIKQQTLALSILQNEILCMDPVFHQHFQNSHFPRSDILFLIWICLLNFICIVFFSETEKKSIIAERVRKLYYRHLYGESS